MSWWVTKIINIDRKSDYQLKMNPSLYYSGYIYTQNYVRFVNFKLCVRKFNVIIIIIELQSNES